MMKSIPYGNANFYEIRNDDYIILTERHICKHLKN